jgi:hypothetical protein
MKVNNEIYETQGHGWWVDDAGFGFSSLLTRIDGLRRMALEDGRAGETRQS